MCTGQSAATKSESRQPLSQIEWLHILKTGTSFGNTLILWACPELDPEIKWIDANGTYAPPSCLAKFRTELFAREQWPIGDHISVAQRSEEELKNVVTMIRWPPALVASWYYYFHLKNQPSPGNVTEQAICKAAKRTNILYIMGWMIAGNKDSDGNRFSDDAMVETSCHRLAMFAFVGVTDLWEASISLFHAMHGGKTHPIELANIRKGKRWENNEAVQYASCGQDGKGTPNDGVYKCGLNMFLDRLKQLPHCLRHLPNSGKLF